MLREQKQEPPTLAFLQGTVGERCGYAEGPSRARERTAANVWEHDASASGKVEGLPKPDTFFFFLSCKPAISFPQAVQHTNK